MTALMRLQAARRALDAAREKCPHWDCESDCESDGEGHDCCHAVSDSQHDYRLAKRRHSKQEQS